MLLILEDNLDKLTNLLDHFRERTHGKTILCVDSVKQGQYLVQKLLENEPFELWLDSELVRSTGLSFFNWLMEIKVKPAFVIITSFNPSASHELAKRCVMFEIAHRVWAGPFG